MYDVSFFLVMLLVVMGYVVANVLLMHFELEFSVKIMNKTPLQRNIIALYLSVIQDKH